VVLLFYLQREISLHFSSSPLYALSLSLFQRLPPHFSTSIASLLYSIFTSSCSQSRERLFKQFHFRFEHAFALKLSFFGFSSIFVCFNCFCYFIQYLFVLYGFGRVCLAELGSVWFWRHNFGLVVFSVLALQEVCFYHL